MGLVALLVFGAAAGWAATLLVGWRRSRRGGLAANVFASIGLGLLGAGFSGLLVMVVTGQKTAFDFDLPSLVTATLGAVALLLLARVVHGRALRSHR
ncbi:hypothetical protein [Actinokineospora iranica]|uniref:Transglycosylase associated protein n=1 Tax=Actinokineospora iranica TaxID=1271860 RepID=A0A1G6UCJ8_9PSEU|nr:hypothetical protein [Actinokineospora iranica]SDD39043.1 hypothetical protein SAMN05216174_110209 [Actinokineospora iranica]